MSNLKKGDFIYVTKGNTSLNGKVLRFWFRKEGFYHYHLYDNCTLQNCDLDNFSKIKLHKGDRRNYISSYDTIYESSNKDINSSEKQEIKNKLKQILKKSNEKTKKEEEEKLRKEQEKEENAKRREKYEEDRLISREKKRKEQEEKLRKEQKEKLSNERKEILRKNQEEYERRRKQHEDEMQRKEQEEKLRKQQEAENLRKQQEKEENAKRREKYEEDRLISREKKRQQLIMEKIEKNRRESSEKRKQYRTKEQILTKGFENEINKNDFLLITFSDNSYILLQCVEINTNNYYFLKLHIVNTKVNYKDDEMNKLHMCNNTCIDDLLKKSSMFTIYHDANLFNGDVYKYIIGHGYTKNVNPFFDKKNTPVIVVSNNSNKSSNNKKINETDKLTIVLKDDILAKQSSSSNKSNKNNLVLSNKSQQNKSRKTHFTPITENRYTIHGKKTIPERKMINIYNQYTKLIKEKVNQKITAVTRAFRRRTNAKTSKNTNNIKKELTEENILENILENDKNAKDYTNNLELKDELKKGGYLFFKIYDKIYLLQYNKFLNNSMYKFNEYYCKDDDCYPNNTPYYDVNGNKISSILLMEKQLNYIILNSEYIILFKELNTNVKQMLSKIMKILPDVNDIKNMKKNMIEALNKSVKI